MLSEELKIAAGIITTISCLFFTVPIALTSGMNVAQRIGLVECSGSVQVQNTK
jgi:uncharacterized membrane protein